MSDNESSQPKTDSGVIKHDSGAHVALLIMKMLRRPVTLDEFTSISAKKLANKNRLSYLERLVKCGYATQSTDGILAFAITRSGVDKVYELATTRPKDK